MAKQILGDNPFADDDATEGHASSASRAAPTAPAESPARAAPLPEVEPEPVDEPSMTAGSPVAAPQEPVDDSLDGDELFLGEEAAVPLGDYGPPIHSVMPEADSQSSAFRELERRVQAHLTPAFPMEQRRRLPLAFLWKRYRRLAMRHRSDVVDDYGRDPIYSARVEPVLDFLYSRYFRVETQGIDNVPAHGRALLVANHSGMLPYDGAILMHAVSKEHPARRELRPLVEDFVFHFPYLGVFINRIGGVRACPENAERLLRDDQLLAVFPEGIKGIGKLYKERYKLQRFGRGGFIKLALRTRTPIVPVAILGAEETHPLVSRVSWLANSLSLPFVPITPTFPFLGPLGLLPLPSKWILHFGTPIDLAADHGAEAAEDRVVVQRLAEMVRSRIQDMIDDALARRRSILFG
jgi:1-acyl-sn-glycerol-3-phosphate acyltransferase